MYYLLHLICRFRAKSLLEEIYHVKVLKYHFRYSSLKVRADSCTSTKNMKKYMPLLREQVNIRLTEKHSRLVKEL